jgi:hypothetical protein
MIPVINSIDDSHAQWLGEGASRRLRLWFYLASFCAVVVLLALHRWSAAVGFAVGAAVSFAGMLELDRAVNAFGLRVAGPQRRDYGLMLAMRFLLRYAVIAAICYVIFRVSRTAFYGAIGALFVPVAAMMCEAGYEAWLALRGKL